MAFAKILIKDEKKGSENTEAVNFLNLMGTKKLLENEKDVITSKTLLTQTVKNLGLYASVFEADKLTRYTCLCYIPCYHRSKKPGYSKTNRRIFISPSIIKMRPSVLTGMPIL